MSDRLDDQKINMMGQMAKNIARQIEGETEEERKERLINLSQKSDLNFEELDNQDKIMKSVVFHIRDNLKSENTNSEAEGKIVEAIKEYDGATEKIINIFQNEPEGLVLFVRYMNEYYEQYNIYDSVGLDEDIDIEQYI
jgi:hypothetical protein